MNICIVTNSRNSSIFGNNLVMANYELGHRTHIFELDYTMSVQQERNRLLEFIKDRHIDMTLFLNDFIFPDKVFFIDKAISDCSDCRLWIWDAMHNVKNLSNHIYLYSHIYSFEMNDIIQLKQYHDIDAKYMPLFAGPEFYSKPRSIEDIQDIDIFFCATIAGSKKRLEILEEVAKFAFKKGYRMIVFGRAWHNHHWYQRVIGKLKFAHKFPYLSKVVENKTLTPHEVINYYKRSKINLNIHIGGQTGYNCRTFEIMGNDNFILSDKQNIYQLQLVEGKHFDTYRNIEELLVKIQNYIENESKRKQIAHSGGKLIREKYNMCYNLKIVEA